MNFRHIAIAALTILLTAPAAAQPFIEIEMHASKEDIFNVTVINARAVFDAGSSEFSPDTFLLVDADISIHTRPSAQFAGSIESGPGIAVYDFDDIDTAQVEISNAAPPQMVLRLADPSLNMDFVFTIAGTKPALQPSIATLPDNLTDYLIDPTAAIAGARVDLSLDNQTYEINEFGTMGSAINRDGAIEYRLRYVDDPSIEPCAADLNNDGLLNFFDVSLYIQLYQAGCP